MSFWDVRRSIVSAQVLIHLAGEHGVSLADCLRGTQIDPEALANPGTEISAAQELHLVTNVIQHLPHVAGLGLEAGLRYHLSAYGIWGFAMVSSPTFRSGCEVAVRYLDLSYAFTSFNLFDLDGPDPRIVLDERAIPAELRQFLIERDFAALINAVQEMMPSGVQPRAIRFAFARPAYAARFVEICGVEPEFGAAVNSVHVDPALLAVPLPQANPIMARLCEDQCRLLLAKRQVRTGLAGKVRDRLLHAPSQMVDIETVAQELCMASRSLRRRLEEEGTSFRALVDEVRATLADELLLGTNMKLDEVAVRLGYSETSSFIHAYKRWKGMSPSEFRTAQARR
jgi:AraC-like DNA-binding protein